MPVERMIPDAILEQTNLTGTLAAIQNDPDTPDGTWLTANDQTLATVLRVSFPTPSAAITGTQEFRARIRQVGGTDDPPINLELWINGTSTLIGPSVTVVNTTDGEIISWTWDAGTYDAAAVECRVNSPSTGGKPATRATCEIESIEWNATTATPPPNPPTDLTATPDVDSISLAWNAPTTGPTPSSYRAYKESTDTFTSSLDGWLAHNATNLTNEGSSVLRSTATATGSAQAGKNATRDAATQGFSISPGEVISFTGDVRVVVGARSFRLVLQFYNSTGGGAGYAVSSSTTSATFTSLSVTATAPTDAARVVPLFEGETANTAVGDAGEIDNAFLRLPIGTVAAPTTSYDDTVVSAGYTYTYAVRSVLSDGTESTDSNSATATFQPTTLDKVDTLSDDFNDGVLDTAKWTYDAAAVESNGVLSHSSTSYARVVQSKAKYDFAESSMFAKITRVAASYADISIEDSADPANNYLSFGIDSADNSIYLYSTAGPTTVTLGTYDPTTDAWMRMRNVGDFVYADTSPDGTTWTERGSIAAPTWKGSVLVGLWSGYTGTDSNTFDNFNVAPGTSEVIVQGADSGTISVTEGSSFPPIAISASDTSSLSLTETSSVAGFLNSLDTGSISITDAASVNTAFEEFVPKTYLRKVSYA